MNHEDIHALIARVKAEADAMPSIDITRHGTQPAPGGTLGELRLPDHVPRHAGHDDARQDAHVGRFFRGDDQAFIEDAYRLLLGREIDDAGRRNYMGQLTSGASRLGIAASLRLSGEGRRAGISVRGLRLPTALALAQRVLRKAGLAWLAQRLLRGLDRRVARRYAVENALERRLIASEQRTESVLAAWQGPLGRVAAMVSRHEAELDGLKLGVSAIEKTVHPVPPVPSAVIDAYYLAFEDANRGSQEDVGRKLAVYGRWLDALRDHAVQYSDLKHAVIDLGCGRGEWLGQLRARALHAVGVDTNPMMVDVCHQRGLDAHCTDGLSFLRALPAGSAAAVTGFHIIEHLPFDYLYALVVEARRVLVEGGWLLFETPNPENVLVGSHTFYHDFTHRNPVTPTAISFLLRFHGFQQIDILRSSPYPDAARVPGNDPLTERVNGHLCGPQDFAVSGRIPRATSGKSRTAEAATPVAGVPA